MSERANPSGREVRSRLLREGRVEAMFKSLLVSLAQVAVGAAIIYGCFTADSVAARTSDSPPGPGAIAPVAPFVLASLLLAPLGAMIIGPLVAKMLRLTARGTYSLSVIAVILLVLVLKSWNPTLAQNLPFLLLVLTGVNLLIGYGTGMDRR
jgi:peptidoglycan/LPS O-acetylase OafA/YrhL